MNADNTIDFQEFLNKLVRKTLLIKGKTSGHSHVRFSYYHMKYFLDLLIHTVFFFPLFVCFFVRSFVRSFVHPFILLFFHLVTLIPSFILHQGVDIISGDINGISTRIQDESAAKADFMKFDQYNRQEAAYNRALGLTGQKSADECMEILKVFLMFQLSQKKRPFHMLSFRFGIS